MAAGDTFRDTAFLARSAVPDTFPVTSGLILRNESYDFDSVSNGTVLSAWADKSGGGHNWTAGNGSGGAGGPYVDQTIKANGHATVHFRGRNFDRFNQTHFFGSSGFAGLEVFCVYKQNADPPSNGDNPGPAFSFNQNNPDSCHQPYSDGNFYENFALSARRTLGNPSTSTSSAFVCYNVAAKADGTAYDAWINLENFYSNGSFTFNQEGSVDGSSNPPFYYLGFSISVGFDTFWLKGNIAACYVFNRRLSSGERTLMRAYITSTYGVTF